MKKMSDTTLMLLLMSITYALASIGLLVFSFKELFIDADNSLLSFMFSVLCFATSKTYFYYYKKDLLKDLGIEE